ncbi:response regulator [Geomesophilobacter sediminis]|uniref:Response regulator n=1 Tax=Geomesophilobacter sediminis TaxID=2798584 RepID=A0A8J7JMC8_9BACT|nr:response regulator [Geomesophilobacter sediminis]MBJ6725720.1 response regulator [Geomesophilobacter sediminis]
MRNDVLVVVANDADDEALFLKTVKSIVPFPVVFAHDGAEALDLLLGTGAYAGREFVSPLMVLLDLNVPRVCGLDVLRRLKSDRRTKEIPVVVWTALNNESVIDESYHLGANSFVTKDINRETNLDKLKMTLEYWMKINLLPPAGLRRAAFS